MAIRGRRPRKSMSRPPKRSQNQGRALQPTPTKAIPVPPENIGILRDTLGLDMRQNPEQIRRAVRMAMSISSSPYPSADMLAEYRDKGFPELPDKVIATIDQQTQHRQSLERAQVEGAQGRLNRAQYGAITI